MTFSGPVINQSACGIYLSHIIITFIELSTRFFVPSSELFTRNLNFRAVLCVDVFDVHERLVGALVLAGVFDWLLHAGRVVTVGSPLLRMRSTPGCSHNHKRNMLEINCSTLSDPRSGQFTLVNKQIYTLSVFMICPGIVAM